MLSLRRGWELLLNLGFGLLCVRYLITVSQETSCLLALPCAAGFFLAVWRPSSALFALILGFCLLSGLEQTVFLFPVALPVATTVWLGVSLRNIWSVRLASEEHVAQGSWGRRASHLVDFFATVTLLHVVVITICLRHSDAPALGSFWKQAVFGFDSPLSYLSLAFPWLHGLFYFRTTRKYPESGIFMPGGIKLIFLVNSVSFLVFFCVQWLWQFPHRWTPGYQSPFQDIGAFGAIGASLLIFCLSVAHRRQGWHAAVLFLGAVFLAIAVAASWSRGTWLASIVFIGVLCVIRLPLRWTLLVAASILGAIIFINLSARSVTFEESPFLARLATLVRFENLQSKADSSGRAGLSHKAWAMIRERPLLGHGIGSFYLNAPRYARPGDPLADIRTTPHDFLLQLAVEYGLPVAILFAGMMATLIWQGVRPWVKHPSRMPRHNFPADESPLLFLALALALALGTYLQANMTWDILLIHPPQPLFFWFVVAALLATLEQRKLRFKSP